MTSLRSEFVLSQPRHDRDHVVVVQLWAGPGRVDDLGNHSLLVRLVRHMRSSDEPTVFVLSRRRAGDAWAPERVESKKRGGAAELDAMSENSRRLHGASLGG